MSAEYDDLIKQQIRQFSDLQALWKLPPIYQYWSETHIKPRFQQVFGFNSIFDAYLGSILDAARRNAQDTVLYSIGAGDCQLEIQLAIRLRNAGIGNVRLVCLELSPVRLERAKVTAKSKGVIELLEFCATDLNAWVPREEVNVFIAHHSLHHIASLERVYDGIRLAMKPDGVFWTADMIGRNGHRRWPEVLCWIQQIWKIMPDRYKHNFQFNEFHTEYLDWDCSRTGFEGIRAEEVLPQINARFDFDGFLGFGGVIDPWVERGYGQSLDPGNPEDTAFIDFLESLNQTLIETGRIKPTMMFGAFRPFGLGAHRTWKGLTPMQAERTLEGG